MELQLLYLLFVLTVQEKVGSRDWVAEHFVPTVT